MIVNITKKAAWPALVLVLSAAGYWFWEYSKPAPTVEVAKPVRTDTITFEKNAPQMAFLKVELVQMHPEPAVESMNARLDYNDNVTARIFSPVAGRVVQILVEAGDYVKKGEPLLRIDSPDFAAATSDLNKADADLVRKRQAFERAKLLLEAKSIAQRDLESAEGDVRQAEAESVRARARLNNLTNGGKDSEFVLRAPIDGVVSERSVNAGSEVRPDAQMPLFIVTDPRHLWVFVDMPELYLGRVEEGQTVEVRVDAYPDDVFPSTVRVIGETLDPVTRRVQVRCELNNVHQHKLRVEMFARVTPLRDTSAEQVRIPNGAIFTQGIYTFVFVELAPGQYQRRKVEPLLEEKEYTYIKHGLKRGERVVTSGALLLNSELSGEI